ncbi:MAG: hypothetical protein P1P83_06605 [Bacteroidales bacterium]|nr:hypothetical protein [Bacteroidales bacterium]MDT8373446.1 hypothetical protein [Bacteroidales bacterium]
MKNLIAIITLSFIYCNFSTLEAQTSIYIGEVEYHLEIIKKADGGGTDKGYNWNVSVDERQIIEGKFFVTFTGRVVRNNPNLSGLTLTDIQEEILFINTVNNEGNEQKISEACYDDRLVFKRNATPGESRTERFGVNWARTDPGKPVIEGGRISFRNNNYYLMLMGKAKLNVATEHYTSLTQPCLDTVIPPKLTSANTTLDFPIVIHAEKPFDNSNELKGTFVQRDESGNDCSMSFGGLGRMVHGDMNCSYVTKITTSWSLTKKCEALDNVGNELDKRKDISQSQKNRIKNVLVKLNDPSVDPYVFTGSDNINSVTTVKQAEIIINNKEQYMTDLRQQLNKDCEQSKSIEELTNWVIYNDNRVVQIVNRFNQQYLSEHILSDGRVKIKDWIADQQRNPNSVYSCYGGE